jgi:hypothetical protein
MVSGKVKLSQRQGRLRERDKLLLKTAHPLSPGEREVPPYLTTSACTRNRGQVSSEANLFG